MGLSMCERKAVTAQLAPKYRKAGKKKKSEMLNQFVELSGYNRKYAIFLLQNWGKRRVVLIDGELVEIVVGSVRKKKRKPREKIYGSREKKALKKVWIIFDCPCGKRLVPLLRMMLPILENFGEIELDESTRANLQRISAATIDRLLKQEKKRLQFRGRTHTRWGSLMKHQIPIRTFGDWDEKKPGYAELDLVGHDGGNTKEDHAFTLNLTDVDTGWTEPAAIQNKAQVWTVQALDGIKQRLPFPLLGIDTDNGSEFLNAHLIRYTEKHTIQFTRSRPYRKNDSCFVEQKNNSVVRRYVGYLRYDTPEELQMLNELYGWLRLYVNFFQPSAKLMSKSRVGSKVKKLYDEPKSPYQRVTDSPHVSEQRKQKLRDQFGTLNPAELHRRILRLQGKLLQGVREKHSGGLKKAGGL
jgi:hypothetical protein